MLSFMVIIVLTRIVNLVNINPVNINVEIDGEGEGEIDGEGEGEIDGEGEGEIDGEGEGEG